MIIRWLNGNPLGSQEWAPGSGGVPGVDCLNRFLQTRSDRSCNSGWDHDVWLGMLATSHSCHGISVPTRMCNRWCEFLWLFSCVVVQSRCRREWIESLAMASIAWMQHETSQQQWSRSPSQSSAMRPTGRCGVVHQRGFGEYGRSQ
jgi:hypothetical protein